jgi:cytochrome c2
LVACAGLLAIHAALLLQLSAGFSRAVLVSGSLLVIAALAGHVLAVEVLSYRVPALTLGIAGLVFGLALVALHTREETAEGATRSTKTLAANEHLLTATTHSRHFPPRSNIATTGGALTADPHGDGYIFARANGQIYRLRWDHDGGLRITDSGARVPINIDEFDADVIVGVDKRSFRVADVLAQRQGAHTRLFTSHHFWKRGEKCFVVRVSSAVLLAAPESVSSDAKWETVFETVPCLSIGAARGAAFAGEQIGGNLEFLGEDKILLTVGDHQFDGWYRPTNHVQDPRAHYGKTVLIDIRTHDWSIFTTGHRNPQGLTVDAQGRIWSTEHGPQGGDELNLLREGGNYGYPMHTYGTEYGSTVWPPGTGIGVDPLLTRPLFAWVPSIAPTDLIAVTDPAFSGWQGDLLIGSLRARAVWRVRVEHGRVVYAEPVLIGQRIRDITAGQGELVLLTDSDDIVRIRPDERMDAGAAAFTLHCGGCHDDAEHRIGPNLNGILNKAVASSAGYTYSPALRRSGGRWTEDRLHLFLADPQAYVPGTAMTLKGIRDTATRQAIIDYIKLFYGGRR